MSSTKYIQFGYSRGFKFRKYETLSKYRTFLDIVFLRNTSKSEALVQSRIDPVVNSHSP